MPGGKAARPSLFQQCILDPLFLASEVNGIAIYRLSTQSHPEDQQTFWKSQIQLSRGVREALAAGILSDVVLNAVRLLGTGSTSAAPSDRLLSRGYFSCEGIESLGGLDLEGLCDFSDDHYEVLIRLVAARGGLGSVQVPGVAEKICRADMVRASLRFERPSVSEDTGCACLQR